MEVHHYPSRKAGEKKKFKEYFFEFIMIFLAVTKGFRNLSGKASPVLDKTLLPYFKINTK